MYAAARYRRYGTYSVNAIPARWAAAAARSAAVRNPQRRPHHMRIDARHPYLSEHDIAYMFAGPGV